MTGPLPEIIEPDVFQLLNQADWFDAVRPLQVDVGAGNGSFVAGLARQHPDMNFLAIERLAGRAQKTCSKIRRFHLNNLRILRLDGAWVVRHMLPPASVTILHICFPDPWPKRRHHGHRLVNPEFATAVHRALVPGGEWRITTDHAEYFQVMTACAAAVLQPLEWTPAADYPQTDFERRFLADKRPIHRARFIKN